MEGGEMVNKEIPYHILSCVLCDWWHENGYSSRLETILFEKYPLYSVHNKKNKRSGVLILEDTVQVIAGTDISLTNQMGTINFGISNLKKIDLYVGDPLFFEKLKTSLNSSTSSIREVSITIHDSYIDAQGKTAIVLNGK